MTVFVEGRHPLGHNLGHNFLTTNLTVEFPLRWTTFRGVIGDRFDSRQAQQHSFSCCQQLAAIKRTIPNLISNRPAAVKADPELTVHR